MYFVMHMNDAGLIAATVQWRGRIEEMAPTATTLALAFSVAIYGLFFAVARHSRAWQATPRRRRSSGCSRW